MTRRWPGRKRRPKRLPSILPVTYRRRRNASSDAASLSTRAAVGKSCETTCLAINPVPSFRKKVGWSGEVLGADENRSIGLGLAAREPLSADPQNSIPERLEHIGPPIWGRRWRPHILQRCPSHCARHLHGAGNHAEADHIPLPSRIEPSSKEIVMSDRPIIFSAPMVRALLARRKTRQSGGSTQLPISHRYMEA